MHFSVRIYMLLNISFHTFSLIKRRIVSSIVKSLEATVIKMAEMLAPCQIIKTTPFSILSEFGSIIDSHKRSQEFHFIYSQILRSSLNHSIYCMVYHSDFQIEHLIVKMIEK